jgi:C4-dicarboxylate-specific signal transduction histidine kinase
LRLLQNAIEAGAHQIWLDARGADAWTEIRVTDRAPGSGAERALDVRPFQTTKAKNIGLGLALVRAAVASMGGRLRVERTGAGETRASLWLRRAASGEATA